MKKFLGKFLVVVVLLGLVALVVVMSGIPQAASKLLKKADIGNLDSDLIGTCPQDPTISPSFVSELYPGTSLSPSMRAKVNGGNLQTITSSTTFSKGDKVALLVNLTSYEDKIVYDENSPLVIDCGPNQVSGSMLALTTFPAVKVIGSDGSALSNAYAGGLTNESSSTGTDNLILRITPSVYTGTGDLVVVIEGNSSTKIDSITSSYPSYNGALKFWRTAASGIGLHSAFKIPSSNSQIDIPFAINPASGQNTGLTRWNITIYQAQDQWDVDGKFYPSMIEQSDGTRVAANETSTAFFIVA